MDRKNLKRYQILKGISIIAMLTSGAYLISCADVIKRSGMFVNTPERSTYDTFDALIDTGYIKGIVAAVIILSLSVIVYLYVAKCVRRIKHEMVVYPSTDAEKLLQRPYIGRSMPIPSDGTNDNELEAAKTKEKSDN